MPIIIHGSRAIKGVKKQGVFHCPQCNTKVNYKWIHVRKWGHIYWIPLAPGEVLGEYVECQACMNTYKPGVLDYDPEASQRAFEASYQSGIKRVMVRMMLADGSIDPAELQLLRGVFMKMTGRALEQAELDAEIQAAGNDRQDIAEALKPLAGVLNDRGKSAVFRAAYLVAAADGNMQRSEMELLVRVGNALGMSTPEIQAVFQEFAPQAR